MTSAIEISTDADAALSAERASGGAAGALGRLRAGMKRSRKRASAADRTDREARDPMPAALPANLATAGDGGLRLLLGLAIGLLITGALVFWIYLQGNASLNALAMSASRASGLAGEMVAGIEAHSRGDAKADEQLATTRAALDRAFSELSEPAAILMASAEMLNHLDSAKATWQHVGPAVTVLLGAQLPLDYLARARRAVVSASAPMLAAARSIQSEPPRGRTAGRDAGRAATLALLTQQLGAAAALSLDPASPAFGSVDVLRETMAALPPALADVAESFPDSVAALALLRAELPPLQALLEPVLAGSDTLAASRHAIDTILTEAASLREELNAIRDETPGELTQRAWLTLAAAALAVLAALSGLAASRIYMRASTARAVQAEQQREVAELLESDAKRTNELNQAAILRLMNELQEVADGDLTLQATVSEDITGAIADSVNYTIEELRSLVSRINYTAEQVNGASSKAQMTVAGLMAATEQQSREIKDTGESVLEMARRINEVSARAAESVKVARQSLTASEGGSKAVNHAIGGMNMIRDQIQETAKRIKRLGESSQEIGEIVELISSLTEQTNTLALNAAIQAASAGEAGRGFSIVAEEVQRLAERSAEATSQISMLIKTIQADTHDAIAAMERSTQGVVDGTRRSDEAGRSLETIGSVSAQLAELIESFSQTTSRQAVSAGTVAQSIQRILLVNEQTSKGTSQTAHSISRLSELAQELKNSVSRFKVA